MRKAAKKDPKMFTPGRIVARRTGGYDPKKGRNHPDNFDPTLEPRSVRGGALPPVRTISPTSAHATIGRILMALLELLDMTDRDKVQRVMLELVPPMLATTEVPALCEALRAAGATKLADTIREAFDMGALE